MFFFSIFSIVSDSNRTGNVRLEPGTIWTSPTLKADYNFSVYKSENLYPVNDKKGGGYINKTGNLIIEQKYNLIRELSSGKVERFC